MWENVLASQICIPRLLRMKSLPACLGRLDGIEMFNIENYDSAEGLVQVSKDPQIFDHVDALHIVQTWW